VAVGLSFHSSLPCTPATPTTPAKMLFCEICNATVKTEVCTVPPKAALNQTDFGSYVVMEDSEAVFVNGKLHGSIVVSSFGFLKEASFGRGICV
jgi:hypothetical protein